MKELDDFLESIIDYLKMLKEKVDNNEVDERTVGFLLIKLFHGLNKRTVDVLGTGMEEFLNEIDI